MHTNRLKRVWQEGEGREIELLWQASLQRQTKGTTMRACNGRATGNGHNGRQPPNGQRVHTATKLTNRAAFVVGLY